MTLSLARRADRFPNRTAIVDISEERPYAPAETIHENRVTYRELSAIATRTAEHLSALDVAAGDIVCLVTRNRVASIALLFACRRLGATFAPISHWLTPASVERPFDVIDPDLVVSEAAQRDLVRSIPFDRSVTLEELADADREPIPNETEGGAAAAIAADRTSRTEPPLLLLHGDDGRPIVGYSARALEWNCVSSAVTWGLSGGDVVPLTAPLSSSDGLVRVALSVLYVGGTLLLDRAFDPGDTVTAIEAENATVLAGRKTTVRDLAAESGFADAMDSVDRTIVEGSIDDDLIAAYGERDVQIVRASGRLECPTAFSQSFPSDRGATDPSDVESTGVGRPIPDCRARLVDDDGTVLVDGNGTILDGEGTSANGNENEPENEATVIDGRLELSGPVVADGYVRAGGTDAENWYESAELQSDEYEGVDDRGRFRDGWFDTDERFRRDENGNYHPP